MHLRILEVKSIMCIPVNSSRIKDCQCIVIRGMQYYKHFGTLEFNDTIRTIYVRFLKFFCLYMKVFYYILPSFRGLYIAFE